MKNFIVFMNGAHRIVKSNRPQGDWGVYVICEAPEGEEIEWLDIVDNVDEASGAVVGKKAIVNQTKKDSIISIRQNTAIAIEYISLRVAEYPPVTDQLDAIYKKEHLGDSTEYDTIAAKIEEIKAKYPKPE